MVFTIMIVNMQSMITVPSSIISIYLNLGAVREIHNVLDGKADSLSQSKAGYDIQLAPLVIECLPSTCQQFFDIML